MKPELEKVLFGPSDEMVFSIPKGCLQCGHNNINNKGECRICIDWRKHVCEFPTEESE